MAKGTVLLTGSTGNLGAVVLEQLLPAGYTVHAVIRSLKKHSHYFKEKYGAQLASGQLQLLEIADMTVAGSFDAAAQQADYIIHVATAFSSTDFLKGMIEPAWTINEAVLTAAAKAPRVRRVVLTGSIVSTLWLAKQMRDPAVSVTDDSWSPLPREHAEDNMASAYAYSKVVSERNSWAFMKQEKQAFDLVVLLAPSITGKSTEPGFTPDKSQLGGRSAVYRELFDREEVGFTVPWFMYVFSFLLLPFMLALSVLYPSSLPFPFF